MVGTKIKGRIYIERTPVVLCSHTLLDRATFDPESCVICHLHFQTSLSFTNPFLQECTVLKTRWSLAFELAYAKGLKMTLVSGEMGLTIGIYRSHAQIAYQRAPSPVQGEDLKDEGTQLLIYLLSSPLEWILL